MGSDNDRRVLLAIILSLGVYYAWVAWFAPPPPAPVEPAVLAEASTPSTSSTPAVTEAAPVAPEPSAAVPARTEALTSTVFQGSITHEAGALEDVILRDYTTSPKVTAVWTWALDKVRGQANGFEAYAGGDDPMRVLSGDGALGVAGVGALGSDQGYLVEAQGSGVVATRMLPSGVRITKRYAPGEDPHTLQVEVHFTNGGSQAVDRLWVGVVDALVEGSGGQFNDAFRPHAYVDGSVEHLADLEDLAEATEPMEGPAGWFGVGNRYFMASLVPEDQQPGRIQFASLPDGRGGAFLVDGRPLDAGAERTYRFLAFVGPKKLDLLQALGHDLDEAVEYGIFGFFSKVLLFLLQVFQKGLVNWGLSIIALTVLVKAVFFPLTQKAFTSSKKMQALQPKLKELQEKYKDNKELQSAETMKLFSEHGVNPLGGCLPSLIQMPVWFALYSVMLYSVELYDSSFLYLQDLTAADPYGVLPVVYAVLIFLQQQMMPMGSLDPTQQKIMKLMPLIFAVWMFIFPSGLVLYFSVNILLTVFQQWLINRTYDRAAGQQQPAAT